MLLIVILVSAAFDATEDISGVAGSEGDAARASAGTNKSDSDHIIDKVNTTLRSTDCSLMTTPLGELRTTTVYGCSATTATLLSWAMQPTPVISRGTIAMIRFQPTAKRSRGRWHKHVLHFGRSRWRPPRTVKSLARCHVRAAPLPSVNGHQTFSHIDRPSPCRSVPPWSIDERCAYAFSYRHGPGAKAVADRKMLHMQSGYLRCEKTERLRGCFSFHRLGALGALFPNASYAGASKSRDDTIPSTGRTVTKSSGSRCSSGGASGLCSVGLASP